jgi:hypothetical protein
MKSSVKAVLAVDVGGSSVKILATRAKRAPIIFIRADAHAQANGFGSQEARRRLGYDVVSIGYPGAAAVRVWVSEPPAGNKQQRTHSATPINVFPWQCRWACPNFEVIAWKSKSILMTI